MELLEGFKRIYKVSVMTLEETEKVFLNTLLMLEEIIIKVGYLFHPSPVCTFILERTASL